jgi:hypothetical protein
MIPVQYRDPQTEEILERRYEEGAPAIGTRVTIGFDEFQVLYHLVHRVRAQGSQGAPSGGSVCCVGPAPSVPGRDLLE